MVKGAGNSLLLPSFAMFSRLSWLYNDLIYCWLWNYELFVTQWQKIFFEKKIYCRIQSYWTNEGRSNEIRPVRQKCHNSTAALRIWLMWDGVMGGTNFFAFWLVSWRYEKCYLPVLSKLSQASMVKIFHFSDEWKVVSVAPQSGTPHKSRGVFYTNIGHGN